MSKENNVKKYLRFIRETNKPLYLHEICDAIDKLLGLEKKLSLREITDIKFMSDADICRRYNLEPRDINSKYVGYVVDKDDGIVEEDKGNVIIVSNHKVLKENWKTDFNTMRNNIMKQFFEHIVELKNLDEERVYELKKRMNI